MSIYERFVNVLDIITEYHSGVMKDYYEGKVSYADLEKSRKLWEDILNAVRGENNGD